MEEPMVILVPEVLERRKDKGWQGERKTICLFVTQIQMYHFIYAS